MAGLALVVALIVGVIGGAYGWERWRTHETEVANRGAVDLVATRFSTEYSADHEAAFGLTYRNDGMYKIIVRDAWFDSENLLPKSVPPILEILPGDRETHIFTMQMVCPGTAGATITPPPLHVRVETIDGAVRDRVIDSDLLDADVVDFLTTTCPTLSYQPSFGETYADLSSVTTGEDGRLVRTVVNLGFGDGTNVQIDGVEPVTPAYTVEYAIGDLDARAESGGPPVTIDFRVADCALASSATENDMAVTIAGTVDGGAPGQLVAYPSPPLAIALTRLAFRSCPS